MKHIYGLQQQQRQQIEQQIDPIQQETKPLEVQTPGVLDLLNLTPVEAAAGEPDQRRVPTQAGRDSESRHNRPECGRS